MNQSALNKMRNDERHSMSVDILTCLCLTLGLTEEEAKDLMARKERTFSPADPRHTALLELIRIYAEKEIDYTVDRITLSTILDDADAYLIERGFDPLPNCNLQREGRTGAPCRRARRSGK